LIDEPSPFASLAVWECHLQQLQELPDDDLAKEGAIELARAMITRLRGRGSLSYGRSGFRAGRA
jgi:hypothetical protein